jgi:hypothetical protein
MGIEYHFLSLRQDLAEERWDALSMVIQSTSQVSLILRWQRVIADADRRCIPADPGDNRRQIERSRACFEGDYLDRCDNQGKLHISPSRI